MHESKEIKYIFITGGVLSSLGKGIAAASIALLLEHKKLRVAMMKLDPYLNIDPGTMSPYQHGEVYVTSDGAETDLDLGHYHRFTNSPLSRKSSVTSGQIYHEVLKRERQGDYLGKTVQVIPHITDEIQHRILSCAHQEPGIDVLFVEIGGTVGDIESLPFLEAIRQLRSEKKQCCLNIHVTYVPQLKASGEVKTKPTQHSVQKLREIGIIPDIVLCRSEVELDASVKEKIALFSGVAQNAVIEARDAKDSIYEVPILLHEQKIDRMICQLLHLPDRDVEIDFLHAFMENIRNPKEEITIGIVGKYVQHLEAYKSIIESFQHAAAHVNCAVKIQRIEPDKLSNDTALPEDLQVCDGYLVPGGFGDRGWQGKIMTAHYCRTSNTPYFGICLGMQVLVVEFARNVLGLTDANSTEMDIDTPHPIISLLEEQHIVTDRGGTMRLGQYPCTLVRDSLAFQAYGKKIIEERHRHRYELNSNFKKELEAHGLLISGSYEEKNLAEIVEVKDHPWMLGVQFHPEFISKPQQPHPLFRDFLIACIASKHKKAASTHAEKK